MRASSTADQEHRAARQSRFAARWLAFAAAPAFALMSLVTAGNAPAMTLCSSGSSILPIDGMTAMYLLMSLFHLSPWLKLAAALQGRIPER